MTGLHKANDQVGDRYKIIRYIGEGGMQFVYAAHDSVLNRQVALKTPKNKSAEKRFSRSAIVAAKVNHPNVAKTLDYFNTQGHSYLIEELIEGEDLDKALINKLGYVDPYLAAKIFHHLAKGIAAAHHAGVVHRDIKPTNIMISGQFNLEEIKITDFGIAKMAEEELVEAAEGGPSSLSMSQTAVGALPYMSPEAIDTPRSVSWPADIWSIGAMMFHLLSGNPPYGTGLKAVKKIVDAIPPTFPDVLTSNPQFSPLANELIKLSLKCLNKNPADRPTADDLVQACDLLCYPTAARHIGIVREIRYNSWGFISLDGRDVFFHNSSVYGAKPNVGSTVLFAKFGGGGAARAHPIVLLQ